MTPAMSSAVPPTPSRSETKRPPSPGERLFQVCGLVVFVALLAAGQVSPDPPSHGSPDAQVVAFYQQHVKGISTGAFLWDVAMMALILFSVGLGRVCETRAVDDPSRGPIAAAELLPLFAEVTGALFLVSQGIEAAAGVIAVHGASAHAIRALDEASHLVAHLGTLPLGSLVFAAGLAQKGTRSTARWIAWLGIVSGGTLVVTTIWIAIGQHWIHDVGVVGLLLFLLWTLASAISLLRKRSLRWVEHHV